jgi:nucleoside-diphosphate-sugar epimerase
LRKSVEAIYNSNEIGGVSRMSADIRQAAALLSYTPRVSLEEGLKRILETDPRFKVG